MPNTFQPMHIAKLTSNLKNPSFFKIEERKFKILHPKWKEQKWACKRVEDAPKPSQLALCLLKSNIAFESVNVFIFSGKKSILQQCKKILTWEKKLVIWKRWTLLRTQFWTRQIANLCESIFENWLVKLVHQNLVAGVRHPKGSYGPIVMRRHLYTIYFC